MHISVFKIALPSLVPNPVTQYVIKMAGDIVDQDGSICNIFSTLLIHLLLYIELLNVQVIDNFDFVKLRVFNWS